MMRAPLAAAYRIAAATPTVVPASCASSTLTTMIFAFGATPTTPTPFAAAAMIPATCVPWPLPSVRSWPGAPVVKSTPCTSSTNPLRSSSTPLPGISSKFVQMFGARSGWSIFAPLSITATVTPAPRDSSQAPGRSSTLPGATAHCSSCRASAAARTVARAAAGRAADRVTAGKKRARSESLLMPSRRATSRLHREPVAVLRRRERQRLGADPRERRAAATSRRGSRAASPSSPATCRSGRARIADTAAGRSPPVVAHDDAEPGAAQGGGVQVGERLVLGEVLEADDDPRARGASGPARRRARWRRRTRRRPPPAGGRR